MAWFGAFLLALPSLFFGATTIQTTICHEATDTVLSAPQNNTVTTSSSTLITGTTYKDSTVAITRDTQPLASVTSDADGRFSVQVALVDGTNQLSITVSSICDITGSTSVAVRYNAPRQPAIPAPAVPQTGTATPNQPGKTPPTPPKGRPLVTIKQPTSPTPAAAQDPPATPFTVTVTRPTGSFSTREPSIHLSGTSSLPATYRISVNATQVAEFSTASTSFGLNVPLQFDANTIIIYAVNGDRSASTTISGDRLRPDAPGNDAESTDETETTPWHSTTPGKVIIVSSISLILIIVILLVWL